MYEQALEQLGDLTDQEAQRLVGITLGRLGIVEVLGGDTVEAERLSDRSVMVLTALLVSEESRTRYRPEIAEAYSRKGDVARKRQEWKVAARAYEGAAQLLVPLLKDRANHEAFSEDLFAAYLNSGYVHNMDGEIEPALVAYEHAGQVIKFYAEKNPNQTNMNRQLMHAFLNIGFSINLNNEPDLAARAFDQAIHFGRNLFISGKTPFEDVRNFSNALNNLGVLKMRAGKLIEARALYEEGL